MLVPGKRLLLQPERRRRWIGVLLFLTVFSLPLHFHVIAANSQVTKECSCFHGNRLQMGATATPGNCVAAIVSQPIVLLPDTEVSYRFVSFQSSRAPPTQITL